MRIERVSVYRALKQSPARKWWRLSWPSFSLSFIHVGHDCLFGFLPPFPWALPGELSVISVSHAPDPGPARRRTSGCQTRDVNHGFSCRWGHFIQGIIVWVRSLLISSFQPMCAETYIEVSPDNYRCAKFCHVFCCICVEAIVLRALTVFILQLNFYWRLFSDRDTFVYYTMF